MWRPSATSKRLTPLQSDRTDKTVAGHTEPNSSRRTPQPPPPTTTLSEVLKANPFRTAPNSSPPEEHKPAHQSSEIDSTQSLNDDLRTFADVYPDVKIEVLRELLLRFDGESRIQICTEQLVKYKSKWAGGQLLNPPRDVDSVIPVEELFRSTHYIAASKRSLATEFSSLNKSVIDAVLAEVNHSYTKARPLLQGIAAKSWRATFTSLFRRKKGSDEAPTFLYDKKGTIYILRSSGDKELDHELEQLFFAGHRIQQRKIQEQKDIELATAVNLTEAKEAKALFECQVCYDDVPFESVTTCTQDGHPICHQCVKRTLHEAIFGQGWSQSIDVFHGTLRCLAPGDSEQCAGHISSDLLHRAIVSEESGTETWNKFEQRLATDNLMKSGIPLTHCPFCHYAEASQVYTLATAHSMGWGFRKQQFTGSLIALFLVVATILPSIIVIGAIVTLICAGSIRQLFNTSLVNLYQLAQTPRFRCRNPRCLRISCLSCNKAWHDPHTCHEPLILSLRTAVEAARTAALKRTCPRCGTSFIKSSGCNKLTCVCGYAMCYLCRKNIGKVNEGGSVDEREGGEGYRHFCEHFRPLPGQKCTECSKCDLYMNENEEVAVKTAGEEAEREWREKEGMVGVKGLGLEQAVGEMGRLRSDEVLLSSAWKRAVTGDWTVQELCDWLVDKLVVIEN